MHHTFHFKLQFMFAFPLLFSLSLSLIKFYFNIINCFNYSIQLCFCLFSQSLLRNLFISSLGRECVPNCYFEIIVFCYFSQSLLKQCCWLVEEADCLRCSFHPFLIGVTFFDYFYPNVGAIQVSVEPQVEGSSDIWQRSHKEWR